MSSQKVSFTSKMLSSKTTTLKAKEVKIESVCQYTVIQINEYSVYPEVIVHQMPICKSVAIRIF